MPGNPELRDQDEVIVDVISDSPAGATRCRQVGLSNPSERVCASEFRRVIGHWATGVSIVTAEGPSGCTVNAITSVSLNPLLLIVCFDVRSNTLAAVGRTGRFCINVLGVDQQGIAARFAAKDALAAKFADVDYRMLDGLPVLSGAIASMHCEVVNRMPAGDHVVLLARPTRLSTVEHPEPLIFYRSAFHRVAEHAPGRNRRTLGRDCS